MAFKRACGYCLYFDCDKYAKGVFLLNHGDTFYCPECRSLGRVEPEAGSYTGSSDTFKEVRVEFSYEPISHAYRQTAVVRDEAIYGRANVYTLRSPLIAKEQRALKVAEAILSNLNRYRNLNLGEDAIPSSAESILSFDVDREQFIKELGRWIKSFENPLDLKAEKT